MSGDSISLSLGGYIYLFILTFLILVAILFGVFVYRQIWRLRYNNAKKEINSRVAAELSRKSRDSIASRIDAVFSFRSTHFPKFTDCSLIAEHANAQHVHRMIAFDEIQRDLDRQLEFINPDLVREPGESTYSFLRRIRSTSIPELKESFVQRLGFLHEWARFRVKPLFGEKQLSELREMLKELVKLLNKNQAKLTSLKLKPHKSRSLEAKSTSLGFRLAPTKDGFLPERMPLLLAPEPKTPTDSPRHSICVAPDSVSFSMDHTTKKSGASTVEPALATRQRLFDQTHLVFGVGQKSGPASKSKFAEEPAITSAMLPLPAFPSNVTRQRISLEQKNEAYVQTNHQLATATQTDSTQTNLLSAKNGVSSEYKVMTTKPTTPKPSVLATTVNTSSSDFGNVVSSVWKKMKQLMGFSSVCHNGGRKNLQGICECPKYFEGELCEHIICINNGTKTRIKSMIPQQEVCKCPHPQFISGNHCEYVQCKNGGKDMGNGSCKCIDDWYTGQFCEFYASSWLAVVGASLLFLAIFILFCIVCRLDLCPRRSSQRDRERRRNYGNYQMPSRRTYANNPHRHQSQMLSQNLTEQARMMQENLLNDAAYHRSARSRTGENVTNMTVYRLESIPTYNPDIVNDFDYKISVPPPTYEQAITRCPTLVQPNFLGSGSALPNYSPPRQQSHSSQNNSQIENG